MAVGYLKDLRHEIGMVGGRIVLTPHYREMIVLRSRQ